jgi:peptidoglycan/LPS O-acetylase OafA/YrhL
LLIDRSTGYDTMRLWLAYGGFALSLPFLFAASKSSSLDRSIGELNYLLYQVRGTMLSIIFYNLHATAVDPLWEVGGVVLSLAAAAIMFLLIDRPVDGWRHRRYLAARRRGGGSSPVVTISTG